MEATSEARPNIRIEIHNNLADAMEVDEEKQSDGEEGEIMDSNEPDEAQTELTYKTTKEDTTDATYANESDKNKSEKASRDVLGLRAKRYDLSQRQGAAVKPNYIDELKESLGIVFGEERNVRFEALHLHGTKDMTADDILEYFENYFPLGIEWINDQSCNVLWPDKFMASKALYFLSKPIKGFRVEKPCETFLDDSVEGSNESCSVLLRNKNREIELSTDDNEKDEAVDISDIATAVPPGCWRLAAPHRKNKFLLIRYSLRTDKKPYKVEKFQDSKAGLISESRKEQFRGIFSRNPDIETDEDNRNPWGSLAKNWHKDNKFAEYDYKRELEEHQVMNSEIQSRLGFKKAHVTEELELGNEEPVVEKKIKMPRMRMYADEEEEKIRRKRQLESLKSGRVKLEDKGEDLREMLRLPSKTKPPLVEDIVRIQHFVNEIAPDLGTKLKNRKLNNAREILTAKRQHNIKSRLNNVPLLLPEIKVSNDYDSRLYSDNIKSKRKSPVPKKSHKSHRSERRRTDSDYEDEYDDGKTGSKVTVVIKKQKTPAVASTIWSRMHSDKERSKTASYPRGRTRSSDSSSDDSSSSSSSSSGSDSDSDSGDSQRRSKTGGLERPGFTNSIKSRLTFTPSDHKSPLRIEINNDHFKKE